MNKQPFRFAFDGRQAGGFIIDKAPGAQIIEGTGIDAGYYFTKRGQKVNRFRTLKFAQDALHNLATDPLTDKGQKIMNAMKDQYGSEKGENVFYASRNKGTISGVDSFYGIAADGTACDIYRAQDMSDEDWHGLRHGLSQYFREEQREEAHDYAKNAEITGGPPEYHAGIQQSTNAPKDYPGAGQAEMGTAMQGLDSESPDHGENITHTPHWQDAEAVDCNDSKSPMHGANISHHKHWTSKGR